MASIKVKFRPSTVAGRDGLIYYQIIQERKVRQLQTDYRISNSEWDDDRSAIICVRNGMAVPRLLTVRDMIRRDLERFNRIIRILENELIPYSADDVVERFIEYINTYSLFTFLEMLVMKLKKNGKERTAETYKSALNSFRKFRNNADIMLDDITASDMEDYQSWQQSRGIALNTISFYMRILRAVYNRAVDEGIIENRNPFRRVYTGVDKTVKRALPLSIIRRIKSVDLTGRPHLAYARDMFILSFILRGMSFVDMAFLRKSDLRNGYIVYRRRKTGQLLCVKWTNDMQVILDRYPVNSTPYLLPIIRHSNINERCAYRNTSYRINHNLKIIAQILNIPIPLTLYVARHSWASAAKAKGIPVSVISEGMGHDSESTTRIYLASLDTSVVDKANALILSSL